MRACVYDRGSRSRLRMCVRVCGRVYYIIRFYWRVYVCFKNPYITHGRSGRVGGPASRSSRRRRSRRARVFPLVSFSRSSSVCTSQSSARSLLSIFYRQSPRRHRRRRLIVSAPCRPPRNRLLLHDSLPTVTAWYTTVGHAAVVGADAIYRNRMKRCPPHGWTTSRGKWRSDARASLMGGSPLTTTFRVFRTSRVIRRRNYRVKLSGIFNDLNMNSQGVHKLCNKVLYYSDGPNKMSTSGCPSSPNYA